jgi:hypothetical protein
MEDQQGLACAIHVNTPLAIQLSILAQKQVDVKEKKVRYLILSTKAYKQKHSL